MLFLLSPCSFFSRILTTQNTSGYLCLLFLCHQKSHTVTTLTPFMSHRKGLFRRSHLHSLPKKKKKKKDKQKHPNPTPSKPFNSDSFFPKYSSLQYSIHFYLYTIQCFSFHNWKSISKDQRFLHSDFIHECIFISFIREYHICLQKIEILKIDKTLINFLEDYLYNVQQKLIKFTPKCKQIGKQNKCIHIK